MWQNSSGATLKKTSNAWQRHVAETWRMPQWQSICSSSTWATVQTVKVYFTPWEGTSRLTSWFSHSHWTWWFSSHIYIPQAVLQTPVSTGWGSLLCFAFPTGQNMDWNILLSQEDRRQWETCFKTLTQAFFKVRKGLVAVCCGLNPASNLAPHSHLLNPFFLLTLLHSSTGKFYYLLTFFRATIVFTHEKTCKSSQTPL